MFYRNLVDLQSDNNLTLCYHKRFECLTIVVVYLIMIGVHKRYRVNHSPVSPSVLALDLIKVSYDIDPSSSRGHLTLF